ncbi:MAG: hypothetical protein ACOYXB_14620 [Bacteroidota bacterium]
MNTQHNSIPNNYDDIELLLAYTEGQNKELAKSINDECVNVVLLKNILENLRSVLDYIAIDLATLTGDRNRNIFFPYGRRQNHFKISIKRNLPKLQEKRPDLFNEIEKIQPFISKNNWLVELCELTNSAKHIGLNKTNKQKSVSIEISDIIKVQSATEAIIENNYINGFDTGRIRIQDGNIIEKTEGQIKMEVTINNKVKFAGKEIEILTFTSQVFLEVKTLFLKIYNKI